MKTSKAKREYMRSWRAMARGVCLRCRDASLAGLKACARCMAYYTERQRPGFDHDLEAHARMLARAHRPDARCSLTGLTRRALDRVGQWLECDRIDPRRGYVPGNMRLLASALNRSKGNRPAPARSAVRALLARVGARAA